MTTSQRKQPDTPPMPELGQQRQPFWREFAALWAFGLREYRIWQSYRVNQVLWMTNLLVTTLLFFLLGQTISGQAASLLGASLRHELYVFCGDRCDGQCLHQHQSQRSLHSHSAQLL